MACTAIPMRGHMICALESPREGRYVAVRNGIGCLCANLRWPQAWLSSRHLPDMTILILIIAEFVAAKTCAKPIRSARRKPKKQGSNVNTEKGRNHERIFE